MNAELGSITIGGAAGAPPGAGEATSAVSVASDATGSISTGCAKGRLTGMESTHRLNLPLQRFAADSRCNCQLQNAAI